MMGRQIATEPPLHILCLESQVPADHPPREVEAFAGTCFLHHEHAPRCRPLGLNLNAKAPPALSATGHFVTLDASLGLRPKAGSTKSIHSKI
jgi:hypothetical protein